MTTTVTTTNGATIYEQLEQLPVIQPDPNILAMLDQLRAVVHPAITEARRLLAEHHATRSVLIEELVAHQGIDEPDVEDALNQLVMHLSGALLLHSALLDVSTVADPDSGTGAGQ